MFPNITHILYDLGNTLVYFDGNWEAVFREAVEAAGRAGGPFGLDPDRQSALTKHLADRLRANYARRRTDLTEYPAREIFAAAIADAGLENAGDRLLETVIASFYSVTQAHWTPVPGTEAALRALSLRGFHQAVLSNAAYAPDVQALVDKAAVRPHLDFVLTSADIGRRKPDPLPFLRAAENWGVEPASVLMVGDNLGADLQGARAAGMGGVWVKRYSEDDPGEIQPDVVIETVAELPGILTFARL
jgi:HAD superfamily hydrolase (TIGR01509 family)